jgi:hypothetical protein
MNADGIARLELRQVRSQLSLLEELNRVRHGKKARKGPRVMLAEGARRGMDCIAPNPYSKPMRFGGQ